MRITDFVQNVFVRKKSMEVRVKSSNRGFSLSNAILCDFTTLTLSSAILPFLFRDEQNTVMFNTPTRYVEISDETTKIH